MHFTKFLLFRLYFLFHRDDALDDLGIVCLEIVVSPCKYYVFYSLNNLMNAALLAGEHPTPRFIFYEFC